MVKLYLEMETNDKRWMFNERNWKMQWIIISSIYLIIDTKITQSALKLKINTGICQRFINTNVIFRATIGENSRTTNKQFE